VLGFFFKAFLEFGIVSEERMQDLDRDEAVKASMIRAVDFCHAATTEPLNYLVFA
jgi:hypothetical protein